MKREIKFRYFYNEQMVEVGSIGFLTDGTYQVNDELVGGILLEYTGLNDKKGKEIYEGDILKVLIDEIQEDMRQYENYQVNFREGCFAVNDLAIGENYSSRELEVIGNIFENPELLKEVLMTTSKGVDS